MLFSSTSDAVLPKETSDNANKLTTVLPPGEADFFFKGRVKLNKLHKQNQTLKKIWSCLKVGSENKPDDVHAVSECTN